MSKLRVAILGCGGMAGGHARRYAANPDVQVVGLCDVTEDQCKAFAARNLPGYSPAPKIYTDPAAMYAEAKLDALTIATPHTLHFQQGMQALEAGCHVLMEKPMVTDSRDAHALAAKVKETGKVFTIGYNTPCSPEFAYLRGLIREKALGRLEVISGWLAQDWKRGTTGLWRQDPKLSGGGQMYDSGAHLFNSLVWLVEQPVADVHAFVDNLDTPVDINGTVNIRFQDGCMANIAISGNCSDGGAGLTMIFSDGRVEVDGWGGSWIRVWKRGVGAIKYPPVVGQGGNPVDNFIDAILGRDQPRTNPINGVIQSELMDAIYESARTGTQVRVQSKA
ncbi:MAG: Gfo/Idh/MocA family oxidoreductase [Armatimonadetes bacterium]|nr:Gfo/Idh/MocA family oxidoreductase [Armatimonadota bacterium]